MIFSTARRPLTDRRVSRCADWIDAATSTPSGPDLTPRILRALRRYGPSTPSLYPLVLRHLTTSSDLLSRHQADVLELLDEVDRAKVLPPVKVVQLLSANGNASVGLVREYLKRQLLADKQELDSVRAPLCGSSSLPVAAWADPTLPRPLSAGPSPHHVVPHRDAQEAARDCRAVGPDPAVHLPGDALLGVRRAARPPRGALHVPPLVPPAVRSSSPHSALLASESS